MSGKVLGFKKKDAVAGIWRDMDLDKRLIYLKMETGELRKVWLVPVVSVEEHEAIVNKERKKHTKIIEEIANEVIKPSITVEWVEHKVMELAKNAYPNYTHSFDKGYSAGLTDIMKAVRKQAKAVEK